MAVSTAGSSSLRFQPVRDAFLAAFEGQPNMGAALAIYHDGLPVVNLWGGIADEGSHAPWREDTLSVIYSCSKGLVSILAAHLVEENLLSYNDLVSRYWPEFGKAGKENVTIADLLSHRAGLAAPRFDLTTSDLRDWDKIVGLLARQEPLWEPGSGHAYHAITHGWLIGEVIRRITGVSVGTYFQQVIAAPLNARAWIGLPQDELYNVAHQVVGVTLKGFLDGERSKRTAGITDWSERAMTLGGALPEELVGQFEGFNNPTIQQAEVPGAGGIATASALAKIWSATVVETDGIRLLAPETVRTATRVVSEGEPVWPKPGPWPRWGMGFQLDSDARHFISTAGFGHEGAGGQVAFAEPKLKLGFAFLTNQMEAVTDYRATHIIDAVRSVLLSE